MDDILRLEQLRLDTLSLKTRRLKYLFRQEIEHLQHDIEDGDIDIFESSYNANS